MTAPRKYASNTRTGPLGRPFRLGNAGKPKGARHRTTQAVESLRDGEAEKLTRKAVEMALASDVTALRLCFERICPPRRDRPVAVELPKIERAADMVTATAALVDAAACGVITPAEAAELGKLIDVRITCHLPIGRELTRSLADGKMSNIYRRLFHLKPRVTRPKIDIK
jgi:hypothetical protein